MQPDADRTEALCWEIRRAFRELAAAGDEALAPLGIKAADRALLELLARESEPVSLAELARRRSVSRQHIHQTLRRLPDAGWIETRADPDDRRSLRIRLSPAGRRLWRRIRARDATFFAHLAQGLVREDTEVAVRALRGLRAALRGKKQEDLDD